jgi:predicted pyridoxine 5'-phosphate oxidase superfamily flavin-nucleotide-binding protein
MGNFLIRRIQRLDPEKFVKIVDERADWWRSKRA